MSETSAGQTASAAGRSGDGDAAAVAMGPSAGTSMRLTRTGMLTGILVVAALFLGSFIVDRLPKSDSLLSETPFLRAGTLGEPVSLRTAEVTVAKVQTAKRIELYRQVSESAEVFLVVDVVWEPVRESSTLTGSSPVVVASDGRVFGGTQVLINNCGPAQTGLPVTCQLPFEISADALEGARLRVPASGSVNSGDDVADIDLGIDAELAVRLSETNAQIKLQQTMAAPR